MTRHPTTAEMRRALNALLSTPAVVTIPLGAVEEAARAERIAGLLGAVEEAARAERIAGLNHRGNEVEDATVGNEEQLRGIPAVGRVSGTMRGTRPGDGLRL